MVKKKNKYNVAVVGVGVVGIEMLRCLKERNFPIAELKVLARSPREIDVSGIKYQVEAVCADSFNGVDIALFAGTEGEKGASLTFASEAVKRGAVVIDNGADFRMDPKVPLVVPEVNAKDVDPVRNWFQFGSRNISKGAAKHKGIIANPNCSTIQMVVALWPVYKKCGIKRIIVTTLQASSGAGRGAVEQLWNETENIVASRKSSLDYARDKQAASQASVTCDLKPETRSMPQQLAFNVFPHIGSFVDSDYTNEEWKLVKETHKIMHDTKIKISATTVRVPVRTGHSESIYIETAKLISAQEVRKLLSRAPGIIVIDDPKNNLYPMPKDAEGKDETFVGRIRQDCFVKNGLWLWVVADNLRKGAATNAVQIAELLVKK